MIKIVYIDDRPNTDLSSYLYSFIGNKNSESSGQEYFYEEPEFKNETLSKLLNYDYVKDANIIIIDSRLYENSTVGSEVLTGEQFQMVLKHINPFIEVIVVSRNDHVFATNLVKKYQRRKEYNDTLVNGGISKMDEAEEYYKKNLGELLTRFISDIQISRKIALQLSQNKHIDKAIRDTISDLLDGINEYQIMTSFDIDRLVQEIKQIESKIDAR